MVTPAFLPSGITAASILVSIEALFSSIRLKTLSAAQIFLTTDRMEGVTIFLDQNENGVRDTGEDFTTTDVNGDYDFAFDPNDPDTPRDLPPGKYTVAQEVPEEWYQTSPTPAGAQSQLGKDQLAGMFPNITEEQIYNIFMHFKPELANSCVRYASGSRFMSILEDTPMPEGAEKLLATARQ